MSYEVLVGIVVVNLAVTLWLWAMLEYKASVKADTPPRTVLSRKIAKEFWYSKPIYFASEPPDATETIKNLTSGARPNLREFFQDFEQFVRVLNHELAEYENFPFRLKDLPDTEVGVREPARRFQIFYNHTVVGELDIEPSYYDRLNHQANVRIRINRTRWIGYNHLVEFIELVSTSVTGPTLAVCNESLDKARKKVNEIRREIKLEMLKTLWSNYTYDRRHFEPDYFGTIEVRLSGSAYFYIEARDRLIPVAGAEGRKPDPRFNDRGPFRRP